MGVAVSTASILNDEIHLFDSFRPDDRVILPEGFHRHVFLIYSLFAIKIGAGATVAVALSFVWDVANGPCGGLTACRLFDDFRTNVNGAVAVIDRSGPIARRRV